MFLLLVDLEFSFYLIHLAIVIQDHSRIHVIIAIKNNIQKFISTL